MPKNIIVLKTSNIIIEAALLKKEQDEFYYDLERTMEILFDKAIAELSDYTVGLPDDQIEEIACHSAIEEFDIEITPHVLRNVDL